MNSKEKIELKKSFREIKKEIDCIHDYLKIIKRLNHLIISNYENDKKIKNS